jgi:hemolysin III
MLLGLREPVSAVSHGFGMLLALPLTWTLWRRSAAQLSRAKKSKAIDCRQDAAYERGKTAALVIYGLSLAVCFGNSALYHAICLGGDELNRFRRLDHVGIYLLIAGTYTPATWALFRRSVRWATLLTVWSIAGVCSARVWIGGVLPTWMSTSIYLAMGWGVLLCYRELARGISHRTLLPLPLGGAFYSAGALINLSGWPALHPGVFGAHELFHFFVIAGSACHARFMLSVVIPARQPASWDDRVSTTGASTLTVAARLAAAVIGHAAHEGSSLIGRLHLTTAPIWEPSAASSNRGLSIEAKIISECIDENPRSTKK